MVSSKNKGEKKIKKGRKEKKKAELLDPLSAWILQRVLVDNQRSFFCYNNRKKRQQPKKSNKQTIHQQKQEEVLVVVKKGV